MSSSVNSTPLQLTIEKVESSGRPGTYLLRGKASLPNKTQLSISAIRNFTPPAAQARNNNPESSSYAILDRRSATVNDGIWQAELSLWQVAPNGRYQETWQLDKPAAPTGSSPDPAVTFLATLDPAAFPKAVDERAETALNQAQSPILSFTPEGEPYLRTAQAIAVALPTGQTQAPSASAESAKNPWEGRSSLNAAVDSDKQAPLPFDDRDNLPMPRRNMMQ